MVQTDTPFYAGKDGWCRTFWVLTVHHRHADEPDSQVVWWRTYLVPAPPPTAYPGALRTAPPPDPYWRAITKVEREPTNDGSKRGPNSSGSDLHLRLSRAMVSHSKRCRLSTPRCLKRGAELRGSDSPPYPHSNAGLGAPHSPVPDHHPLPNLVRLKLLHRRTHPGERERKMTGRSVVPNPMVLTPHLRPPRTVGGAVSH